MIASQKSDRSVHAVPHLGLCRGETRAVFCEGLADNSHCADSHVFLQRYRRTHCLPGNLRDLVILSRLIFSVYPLSLSLYSRRKRLGSHLVCQANKLWGRRLVLRKSELKTIGFGVQEGTHTSFEYGRYGNPTTNTVELKIRFDIPPTETALQLLTKETEQQ